MESLIRRVGAFKAAFDNGFSRVGPELKADDRAAAWLTAAAGRCCRLADAVALLCKEQHADEALPLLRALGEVAAAMGWIAADPTGQRLLQEESRLREPDWKASLDGGMLRSRLTASGLPAAEAEEWIEAFKRHFRRHLQAGASGMPWSHVFGRGVENGEPPEDVLAWTARLLQHALSALNARWPGAFVLDGQT